nr:Ig-like domain-containing protein [uncultured Brevundimonas sp.]
MLIGRGKQTISFGTMANASLSASPLTSPATASSGLAVSFFSDTTAICSVSGTTLILLQIGTCTIRAEQPGDSDWTDALSVSQSFTVTLGITAAPASDLKVGGAHSQLNSATGGVTPYTYSLAAGAIVLGTTVNPATGEVFGTPTVAGSFSYIIRATDSQSLFIDTPVTTVTISNGMQTIAFTSTPASAVVGGPDYTVTATSNSGLWVTFTLDGTSTGCAISGSTVTFTTLGACMINANQAGDTNWNPAAQVQQSFAVTAVPATVTDVSDVSVNFNMTTPIDLSGSITGVRTSMAIASELAHGSVSISGYVVTYIPATNYAGPDSFTFTAIGVGGTSVIGTVSLTVDQGTQAISFGALSNALLSAAPLTLSATASSGLAVTFFSDTTAICTVSGTSLTLIQTGTCTIRAEQSGNATWAGAPSVSRSFTVTPAILVITATPATGLQVGGSYSQANPALSGVAPCSYGLAAGAFVTGTPVDPSTGAVSGMPTVAGSFSYIVRATDSQPLTVDTTVTTVTIAKGDQTLAFTSTAVARPAYDVTVSATSGLDVTFTLDGSSTSCVLSGSSVTFATPGTCVVNANQRGDSNWNPAAQVQQSFAVVANPPIAADRSGVMVPYGSRGTAIDLSGSLTGEAHTSITIGTVPAHGTVSVPGGVVTYVPTATYYGPDSFTYTATGPGGTSDVATVSLTVDNPPAPTVTAVTGVAVPYVSSGTAIDLSSAIIGVHSSIAIGTAPAHGTVTIASDVITYTSSTTYFGANSFTFTATGPGGTSPPATVSLTVATPPPPVIDPPTDPVVVPPSTGGRPSRSWSTSAR